jgi:hypothetical protein
MEEYTIINCLDAPKKYYHDTMHWVSRIVNFIITFEPVKHNALRIALLKLGKVDSILQFFKMYPIIHPNSNSKSDPRKNK